VSEEIKIVIYLKEDKAIIGVSKPDCDPIFRTAGGDLAGVLEETRVVVAEATAIWNTTPRYPKCESKLPSQETPPARTTSVTRQTQTTPKKEQKQRTLF
jgi:hypothetical protein